MLKFNIFPNSKNSICSRKKKNGYPHAKQVNWTPSLHFILCGVCSVFKCSFDEFVWEKVASASYSSAILAPPAFHSWTLAVATVVKFAQLYPTFFFFWTVACQAPLSMEFSKEEHWSGLSFPSPGDFPNSGVKLRSPALQADSVPSTIGATRKAHC